MTSGGYRPSAGRPKGVKDSKPRKPYKKRKPNDHKQKPAPPAESLPQDVVDEAKKAELSPLDYMLKVINDPLIADDDRKDKLAIAAAQYVHPRPGAGPGKKQEREERAKAAGSGKFAPSAPPKLKAVK